MHSLPCPLSARVVAPRAYLASTAVITALPFSRVTVCGRATWPWVTAMPSAQQACLIYDSGSTHHPGCSRQTGESCGVRMGKSGKPSTFAVRAKAPGRWGLALVVSSSDVETAWRPGVRALFSCYCRSDVLKGNSTWELGDIFLRQLTSTLSRSNLETHVFECF